MTEGWVGYQSLHVCDVVACRPGMNQITLEHTSASQRSMFRSQENKHDKIILALVLVITPEAQQFSLQLAFQAPMIPSEL